MTALKSIPMLLVLLAAISAGEAHAEPASCRQASPYYFSEFDPARGLMLEKELNYEEVYRNYEFYEIFFNESCDLMTVKRYISGSLNSTERFVVKGNALIKE